MKTKIKILLIAIILVALAYVAFSGVRAVALPATASALGFDHSNCQYPDRTTNPVDGCDNTDPCDPAQTKGGSGDCLPTADKDPSANLPDPDRPYYDAAGNKYDYLGNLIEAAPAEAAAVPACTGGK